MKKVFMTVMFTVAIMAAGYSSYKTISSYRAINVSESDLLISENIEALSSGGEAYDSDDDDKPTQKKKIKVLKDSGACYKVEYTDVQEVDLSDECMGYRYYVKCTPQGGWSTCKTVETDDLEAEDQCVKQKCAEGLTKELVMEGWHCTWLEGR